MTSSYNGLSFATTLFVKSIVLKFSLSLLLLASTSIASAQSCGDFFNSARLAKKDQLYILVQKYWEATINNEPLLHLEYLSELASLKKDDPGIDKKIISLKKKVFKEQNFSNQLEIYTSNKIKGLHIEYLDLYKLSASERFAATYDSTQNILGIWKFKLNSKNKAMQSARLIERFDLNYKPSEIEINKDTEVIIYTEQTKQTLIIKD